MSHHHYFKPDPDALKGIPKDALVGIPRDRMAGVSGFTGVSGFEGTSRPLSTDSASRSVELTHNLNTDVAVNPVLDDIEVIVAESKRQVAENFNMSPETVDRLLAADMDRGEEGHTPSVYLEQIPDDSAPMITDFDAMALSGPDDEAEEVLPDLTESQLRDFSVAVQKDRILDTLGNTPVILSTPMPPPEHLATSLLHDDFSFLVNPMPFLNEDGSSVPMGEDLVDGHGPLGAISAEDQLAITEFVKGIRKELTDHQKNILVGQLMKGGGLQEALEGRSSSPALNSLFKDIRRMRKRGPMVFGRPVLLKQRTSKTRSKKKKHK